MRITVKKDTAVSVFWLKQTTLLHVGRFSCHTCGENSSSTAQSLPRLLK
jgi:hypothetical protein